MGTSVKNEEADGLHRPLPGCASPRQLHAGQAPVPQACEGASGLASAGLLPPLKSVAYQPLPFRAKPADVTCLAYASLPHDGHTVRWASDTFCISSWAKPQEAHLDRK